jgi:allantoinase
MGDTMRAFLPTPAVVRAERIVTPKGIVPGTLHLARGRIVRISTIDDIGGASRQDVLDAGGLIVIPGLVDTHVHINEPGRTEWEGFLTATRAAAAGGVTTLLDMPLNSVPATTNASALEKKRKAAAGRCHVDVGFLGGLVPRNHGDLAKLWEQGVFAFKCFLVPSGVKEFENVTSKDLRAAMPVLAQLGAPLMVHAELPGPIEAAMAELAERDRRQYATYLASRPPAAEVEAVRMVLELARYYAVRVHIVHVSACEVLPLLREARANRLPVSAETCPHYLAIEAEQIQAGVTEFKCAPPIRGRENRDCLWNALADGTLDAIVSDHSPCPPDLKQRETGDFFAAWGGVASLELGLSVVWTETRQRGGSLESVAGWMAQAPAKLAGLQHLKGRLAPGLQADLALMDPDETFPVDPKALKQRHPVTPYAGRTLHGRVHATYLRGELIFRAGEMVGEPRGRLLARAE